MSFRARFPAGAPSISPAPGVLLADSLGITDSLCFGSESGDINALSAAAENLSSPEFLDAIRSAEKSRSHQRSAEAVYRSMYGEGFPTSPNDILAVSYLAALKNAESAIRPFTYKRQPGFTASGTRAALLSGGSTDGMIPEAAKTAFSGIKPTDETLYSAAALMSPQYPC